MTFPLYLFYAAVRQIEIDVEGGPTEARCGVIIRTFSRKSHHGLKLSCSELKTARSFIFTESYVLNYCYTETVEVFSRTNAQQTDRLNNATCDEIPSDSYFFFAKQKLHCNALCHMSKSQSW